jgi:excisionase family DNA binding protein
LVRNGGPGRWLTLGEASRTLGVTPNTLRRWADRGEIPSFTTPGGHRRFPLAAVEALVPAKRARRPALTSIGASSDHMARAYRRARPAARKTSSAAWASTLTDKERAAFRERGMRLVANLLAHLDAGGSKTLRQAELEAREYGAAAARFGASLTDAVEGFLRFRKPFVDELAALARRRHLDTREATDLLADADAALDRLLVAVMSGYGAPSR